MDLDVKKIEEALEKGDRETLQSEIEKMVEKKMTDSALGESLIALGSVYMDLSNSVNQKYIDALKETIEALKKIDVAEKYIDKEANLREIKTKIENKS